MKAVHSADLPAYLMVFSNCSSLISSESYQISDGCKHPMQSISMALNKFPKIIRKLWTLEDFVYYCHLTAVDF